jgi:hypothetical protein
MSPTMLSCLLRIILSLVCFPLLGAYGLRWAGRYAMELAAAFGLTKGLAVPFLDVAGAGLGLLIGVYLALALIPSCCQRRDEALRATGDILLVILALLLLTDAVLPVPLAGTGTAAVLPPVTLAVWLATGAATLRLARLRRRGGRVARQVAATGTPDAW